MSNAPAEKWKRDIMQIPPELIKGALHECVIKESGELVCICGENNEAANLIAAAAELLEAAKNLENDDCSIPKHAWDLLQAAIKKAEGK